MLALCLAVKIRCRDTTAVEELISAIASCYAEQDAVKTIFKPLLAMFNAEDREWFDQFRQNASWN